MSDTFQTEIQIVSELEQKCRSTLQYDSVFQYLNKKQKSFDEICALLDFIGDSEIALASVETSEQRDKMDHYFLAYGLLQLIYTRQISLKKMLAKLGAIVPPSLKQNSIEQPRHLVIGHPTTSGNASHVILRNTLSAEGFEIVSYLGVLKTKNTPVEYEPLLIEHRTVMREGLTSLFEKLAEIENQRRTKMRKNPLHPAFQGIDYIVRCLVCATVEEKYDCMVESNVKMLKKSLVTFRGGLVARRGEDQTAYHVDNVLEGAELLLEFHPFVDARSRLRFRIVADGIESNMNKLFEMAQQIDESECEELS